jgi:hypothetical protein
MTRCAACCAHDTGLACLARDALHAQVPPFSSEVRKRAVAAAQASRSPSELQAMVDRIVERRHTLVEQLASLRVQEMLSSMSAIPPLRVHVLPSGVKRAAPWIPSQHARGCLCQAGICVSCPALLAEEAGPSIH